MTRTPGQLITKDPDSIEPWGFDWTDWLSEIDPAETISNSTYEVTAFPSADGGSSLLTLSAASIVSGSLKTQVTLTAGSVGGRYTVTNHIVSSSGKRDDRSFYVLVEQK